MDLFFRGPAVEGGQQEGKKRTIHCEEDTSDLPVCFASREEESVWNNVSKVREWLGNTVCRLLCVLWVKILLEMWCFLRC